ncbi:MAG: sel1 repeat family protein [Ruminococcaceae bacterium]|nr:sel1 repeat family protein [Oscillospiraceae bacterium]
MYEKLKADVEFLDGNYQAAADMYLEGAREGDSLAAFNYGYCLLHGYGRTYDPKEAKSYFSFARNMEGGEAYYNLAMLYLHGEGVAQDFELALRYMRMSAEDGCIEAQLYMGMASTLGCMFEPDVIGICMIPYHKPEYRDITTPLLSGYVPDFDEEDKRFAVIKADARAAFEWFRTAARHDPTYVEELSAKGKYLYAKCFIDGLGTEFDRKKGERLMLVAGKGGSAEAVAYLKENGVTPEMIYALGKR